MSKNNEETERERESYIKVEKNQKNYIQGGHRTGSLKFEWATEMFVLFWYF